MACDQGLSGYGMFSGLMVIVTKGCYQIGSGSRVWLVTNASSGDGIFFWPNGDRYQGV